MFDLMKVAIIFLIHGKYSRRGRARKAIFLKFDSVPLNKEIILTHYVFDIYKQIYHGTLSNNNNNNSPENCIINKVKVGQS